MRPEALLELRNITHSYGATPVLKRVDFALRTGEIHALCGENGAGKSTLVKIVAGLVRPTAGDMLLEGRAVAVSPEMRRRLGISIVPQHVDLFPGLTVAENLFITRLPRTVLGTIDLKKLHKDARHWLDRFSLDIDPSALVETLPFVQQKLLLIVKALKDESRIVILDEPTASLSQDDIDNLFDNIRAFNREGVSFIYISHHLEEIFSICHTVTTLRDGRVVRSCPIEALDLRTLIADMVGDVAKPDSRPLPATSGEPVIRIRNLRGPKILREFAVDVHAGEIVGVVGHRASGKDELLDVLLALRPGGRKDVFLKGAPIVLDSPRAGLSHGICLLPADRHRDGLFLDQSIVRNITISDLAKTVDRRGFFDSGKEAQIARKLGEELSLRAASIEQEVQFLSGGNQQKVVFSKMMHADPIVLILDSPTVGVDVRSRSEIHNAVRAMAANGVAVLLVSSDVDEVLALSDRVNVMFKGRITHEISSQASGFERANVGYLLEGGQPH